MADSRLGLAAVGRVAVVALLGLQRCTLHLLHHAQGVAVGPALLQVDLNLGGVGVDLREKTPLQPTAGIQGQADKQHHHERGDHQQVRAQAAFEKGSEAIARKIDHGHGHTLAQRIHGT